ncbi:putative component of NuA3 histone acetyltransferase complex [Sorochytrium milnesiophthora]
MPGPKSRPAAEEELAEIGVRAAKKLKTEDVESVFQPALLSETSRQSLAKQFRESKPYLHCCIDRLVDDAILRKVRDEIWANLHFTEKETDIYKVNQTGDLANIDGLPVEEKQRLATLHQLRNALYSSTFRQFLSDVTGCGPLSGTKQDMSINSYSGGCHLLNHDDVIGTRRVSYILYLPDPDVPWRAEDGGALELYPCVARNTPDVAPTVSLPPKFNQFVMFTVQPGYSFHSVQEVVVRDKDRLSISGWFHLPQEGEIGYGHEEEATAGDDEKAQASLEQLENGGHGDEFPFTALTHHEPAAEETEQLTSAETDFLAQYVNPQYLDSSNLAKINATFCEESSIQLAQFLHADLAGRLAPLLRAEDQADALADGKAALVHGAGVRDGWTVYGSPVRLRYTTLGGTSDNEAALLLQTLEQQLFASDAFIKLLRIATSLTPTSLRRQVRRFRPGLDYTLATSSPEFTLDATLSLTPPHTCWADGRVGGYECYIAPDEGNDDPAVYRGAASKSDDDDQDGALLTVPAQWNTLTLVLREAGILRFVKYVSARAAGSRWDVAAEYLVPAPEEDDDDDDDDEEEGTSK